MVCVSCRLAASRLVFLRMQSWLVSGDIGSNVQVPLADTRGSEWDFSGGRVFAKRTSPSPKRERRVEAHWNRSLHGIDHD